MSDKKFEAFHDRIIPDDVILSQKASNFQYI